MQSLLVCSRCGQRVTAQTGESFSEVDTSDDTKTCTRCSRVLPAAEFVSETLGPSSECTECLWERMCEVPEADLNKMAEYHSSCQKANQDVFRRVHHHNLKTRGKILERLSICFGADPRCMRLWARAEAGHVEFLAGMRKRRARRRGAGDRTAE